MMMRLMYMCVCDACRIRVAVHSVVCTKYFEMLVMTVICLSSISLAAEDPVDEESSRNQILQYMDYCFTGVFACEMLLKVWAHSSNAHLQRLTI